MRGNVSKMAKGPTASTKSRRKKPAGRKKKKVSRLNLKTLVYAVFLGTFFLFSLAVLTYVVFFRMVVAAELNSDDGTVVFEEPGLLADPVYEKERQSGKFLPRFAIIVDDMGYHLETGKAMIGLDLNLSFSFLPHAPHTPELEAEAFRKGRDVLLHLPLQPKDSKLNPGVSTLYLDQLAQQKQKFLSNLSKVPHAVGVNNHMGSLYTENDKAMASLLAMIDNNNLFFVDSFTSPNSIAFSLSKDIGMVSARRDIFLDNSLDISSICGKIAELIKIAQLRGKAIGIAHPHQQTYDALQSCLEGIEYEAELIGIDQLLKQN